MDGVFNASLIAPVSTVFGTTSATLVTAYVTLRLARRKEKTEVQVTLNDGFKTLISELQEERTALVEIVQRQAKEITRLRVAIRQSEQKGR